MLKSRATEGAAQNLVGHQIQRSATCGSRDPAGPLTDPRVGIAGECSPQRLKSAIMCRFPEKILQQNLICFDRDLFDSRPTVICWSRPPTSFEVERNHIIPKAHYSPETKGYLVCWLLDPDLVLELTYVFIYTYNDILNAYLLILLMSR